MKELSLKIQSFTDIRSKYVYVDKTEYIYKMVAGGKNYFLSRPRHFGKTLLVSTLDALFDGKKELFEGLWIYHKWDWSKKYPVVRIDWTRINHSTPETMEIRLCNYLNNIAQENGISLTNRVSSDCLDELLEQLHKKTGEKAVILIDGYDKPLISHLFDSYLDEIKTVLHNFYQAIKGADEHIHFVFITGVSRFSGISVLNNFDDVTLDREFASICGYTQEELENYYMEHINDVINYYGWSREKVITRIHSFYYGYSWDGKTFVYDPCSIMRFFRKKMLNAYWYSTGNPFFLIDMLQKSGRSGLVLNDISVSGEILSSDYVPENMKELSLLFQTGYLTVKDISVDEDGRTFYRLGIPNRALNDALLKQLLFVYGEYSGENVNDWLNMLKTYLQTCNEEGFIRFLESMFATVSNKLNREAHCHTLVLIWLRFIGFEVYPEMEISNDSGRTDAVWKQPALTVIVELSYHKTKSVEALIWDAMNYAHDHYPFKQMLGRVMLLCISFSGTKVACEMKSIRS
jgi:hypothetical protein